MRLRSILPRGASLAAFFLAWSAAANAAPINLGMAALDSDDSARRAIVVDPAGYIIPPTNSTTSPATPILYARGLFTPGFPTQQLLSNVYFNSGSSYGGAQALRNDPFATSSTAGSINIGSFFEQGQVGVRGTLEVDFGGPGTLITPDTPGMDDLYLFENGSPGQPEFFGVAVRAAGSSAFTDFYYNAPDAQFTFNNPTSFTTFQTSFDVTDFGLAAGTSIEAVRIRNILGYADSIQGSSGMMGRVLENTAANGVTSFTLNPGSTQVGPVDFFTQGDPDLTVVIGNNLQVVPEPASVISVACGLIGVGYLVRRRRRRSA